MPHLLAMLGYEYDPSPNPKPMDGMRHLTSIHCGEPERCSRTVTVPFVREEAGEGTTGRRGFKLGGGLGSGSGGAWRNAVQHDLYWLCSVLDC